METIGSYYIQLEYPYVIANKFYFHSFFQDIDFCIARYFILKDNKLNPLLYKYSF